MPDTSADVQDGDSIVDSNGVVWTVAIDTRQQPNEIVLVVSRDSVRTYDTADDEAPVVRFPRQTVRGDTRGGAVLTTREVTDALNRSFATPQKQNILLRVRASPDAPSGGIGAGLFIALLVIAALAESGKRRR